MIGNHSRFVAVEAGRALDVDTMRMKKKKRKLNLAGEATVHKLQKSFEFTAHQEPWLN
jgi:hypothetical protein